MERLTIYHTNDMHSHLQFWPRIAKTLREQKKKRKQQNETVFSFDIGDASDRTHPLTEATDGKAITNLLNEADYDAVTIGNNEGIGNTKEQLNSLYEKANYSVIVSNLKDKETQLPPHWADVIKIYQTGKGSKVGVIACTIPLSTSYDYLGWLVEDPLETIDCIVEHFKESVDVFILLSHLGIQTDREIAASRDDIAIILGAHTHHLLPQGEYVNQTLLAGAGKFGQHIGEVTINLSDRFQTKATARVIDVEQEINPPSNEKKLTYNYNQVGEELLEAEEIAYLPNTLEVDWEKQTHFVTEALTAVKERTVADASILNAGLFLKPIQKGIVTYKDIHEALPHPMRLITIQLSGKKLIELINSMEEQRERLRDLPVVGYGFRGKVFGELCYNGIQIDTGAIYIQGSRVDKEKAYTIITVDYFLYVPFFPIIQERASVELVSPAFLREIIADYLRLYYPIDERKE